IAGDHRLTNTIRSHKYDVALFAKEAEREHLFESSAIDFARPVPIEVGHRLEASDTTAAQAPLETALATIGQLHARHLFEQGCNAPASGGRPSNQIDRGACRRTHSNALELYGQSGFPLRLRRSCAHRNPPKNVFEHVVLRVPVDRPGPADEARFFDCDAAAVRAGRGLRPRLAFLAALLPRRPHTMAARPIAGAASRVAVRSGHEARQPGTWH